MAATYRRAGAATPRPERPPRGHQDLLRTPRSMGIFDKLKGIKEPAEGTPVQPGAHLYQWLLGLGGEQVPFSVAPDASGTGDLVLEWKIVDAAWYEIFGKAGLEKAHRIYLVLDEQ